MVQSEVTPATRTVTLERLQALSYRSEAIGRGSKRRRFTNAIVVIEGAAREASPLRGVGEAQFRGSETGDRNRHSWEFLQQALGVLGTRSIDCRDRSTALHSIRAIMDELRILARQTDRQLASSWRLDLRSAKRLARVAGQRVGVLEDVPAYAGTLFGIETALLDVCAQAMGLSISELLSTQVRDVPVLAPVAAGGMGTEELIHELQAHHDESDSEHPIWLDFERSLRYDAVLERVRALVAAAGRGEISPNLVLRRALRLQDLHHRPALLREIQHIVERADRVSLTVATDLSAGGRAVMRHGRSRLTRVAALRPAAVGGILTAREVAVRETAQGSGRLYIVDSEAGGAVASAALRQLAATVPGVAGVVAQPPEGQDGARGSTGLGVGVPWEEIVDAVTDRITVPDVPETTIGPQPNVYREVPFLQPLGPNGTKGHLLERQALALGMSTVRFSKGAFYASDGVHEPLLFKWSRSPMSSASSLALATHKEATRLRLGRAGVPVPRGRTFRNGDFATAREFADLLGYPVVVKPAMGVRGIGVVAGISNRTELESAFDQLRESKLGSQDFIVEKHIPGKDYRIVVIGDQVIAAILRDPASVVGDGVHNVAELIIRKNATRRLNPHLWGRPILYGAAARYQLSRAGLTLESVPEAGDRVILSNTCSLSQGGDSVDVLDELHPSIKEASVAAVKAVPGLAFCGVDFLLEDHHKPLSEQEAGICELNAHAAIGNCEYPTYGTPREVARTFMNEAVARYDLQVAPQHAEQLSLRLVVRGRVTGVGYRRWMRRQAVEFGLTGWVRNISRRRVEVVLVGETIAVSALAAAAVLGSPRSRPTSVTTEHVQPPDVTDFRAVRRAPQELTSVR
ncbi:acylphosphatase [Ruania suaedae]|uniref:acylphosphatase n=1 Tax=Ruania suaedae TaxID=2897774 RepID=UPI001E476F93|nr:acylphosphatase [Ruania suaedae]UFU02207.1 acylphosphatase [Ruania suaedae]